MTEGACCDAVPVPVQWLRPRTRCVDEQSAIDPLALDFERSKGTVWVGNQLVDAGTTDGCKGKLEILD